MKQSTLFVPVAGLFLTVGAGCYDYSHVHHTHAAPPPHAPAHGVRSHYAYWYYPDQGVYFDYTRNLYFYYEVNTWRSAPKLPPRYVIKNARRVELKLDVDRPHVHHLKHKAKYPPGQAKKIGKPGKGKPSGHPGQGKAKGKGKAKGRKF